MNETENKLIAEFMAIKETKGLIGDNRIYYDVSIFHGINDGRTTHIANEDDFQFHRLWDWLIPAAKKCSDISLNQKRPNKDACNKLDWIECEIGMALRDYDIQTFYNKVIEFIKLYNYKN